MTTDQLSTVVALHWCALLETDTVAADDDFFELGGDSMQALQLAERVETQLDITFPLDDLFLHGTFGAVVAACHAATPGGPATAER